MKDYQWKEQPKKHEAVLPAIIGVTLAIFAWSGFVLLLLLELTA